MEDATPIVGGKMSMLEALPMVAIAVQAHEPVVCWGSPGIGKTRAMEALAKQLNRMLVTIIAAIHEPSDFAGLPIAHDGEVVLAPPKWAKDLVREKGGILFLDEISTAPPAVQAALLRVVLDRIVGDLKLPDEVSVVAAANPPESAAGGWDLTPPLANRFVHIELAPNADEWCQGMISGFQTPVLPVLSERWQDGIGHRMALIAAYIKRVPEQLLMLPDQAALASKAWPSPRTWHMAARLWAACDSAGAEQHIVQGLISGCIGPGPALEMLTWVEKLDLPDPELILDNPQMLHLPDRGDLVYAVLAAVASAVVRKNTAPRWRNAWKVLAKAADLGSLDVAAHAARVLANNRPANLDSIPPEVQKFTPILMGSLGGARK